MLPLHIVYLKKLGPIVQLNGIHAFPKSIFMYQYLNQ